MDDDKIILELTGGTMVSTTIEGYFHFEGRDYIVLTDDNSDAIYVYRMVNWVGDDFELEDIRDKSEFDRVIEELDNIIQES